MDMDCWRNWPFGTRLRSTHAPYNEKFDYIFLKTSFNLDFIFSPEPLVLSSKIHVFINRITFYWEKVIQYRYIFRYILNSIIKFDDELRLLSPGLQTHVTNTYYILLYTVTICLKCLVKYNYKIGIVLDWVETMVLI